MRSQHGSAISMEKERGMIQTERADSPLSREKRWLEEAECKEKEGKGFSQEFLH